MTKSDDETVQEYQELKHNPQLPRRKKPNFIRFVATTPTGAAAESDATRQQPTELIPHPHKRLALTVNLKYRHSLRLTGTLGYERPADKRFFYAQFYEVDFYHSFRRRVTSVQQCYLKWKFCELDKFSDASVTIQVDTIAILCVNVCMMALYAKISTIHKQCVNYGQQFLTAPAYLKDSKIRSRILEFLSLGTWRLII